jgi:hypoxanthine phosphoribosyltransferase
MAREIDRDHGDENPLFLSVLNGSFMFTADLFKELKRPCRVSFVKMAS